MERRYKGSMLISTKLTIPPQYSKKVLSRQTLYTKLAMGARRPLTLVVAPAGFGKTTLISDWLRQYNLPAGWLSLDKEDNEPVRFWNYLFAALRRLNISISPQAENLLSAPLPSPIEDELIALINDLSVSNEDVILVVDNYQVISNPAIIQACTFFIEHLPPHFHLLLLTREEPSFSLARMYVRGSLAIITANDLRFTQEETCTFLIENMGLQLETCDCTALHRITEGWIAGLHLAALSLQGRDEPAFVDQFIRSFAGTHRYVLNYLTEEVFSRLSDATQSFLLQTSILDELNASLCDHVMGVTNSREILGRLLNANLFLFALDDAGSWYRYHQLFADLLRYKLKQVAPETISTLHLRAAEWLLQHGDIVKTVRHLLAGQFNERVASVLEEHSWTLMRDGKGEILLEFLSQLPVELIWQRPELAYAGAKAYFFAGRFSESEQATLLIEQALHHKPDSYMKSKMFEIRATIALVHWDGPSAIYNAKQALKLLPEDELEVRSSVTIALACGHLFLGNIMTTDSILAAGRVYARRTGSRILMNTVTMYQGVALYWKGKLREAMEYYKQIHPSFMTPWLKISLYMRMAEIYREWNNLSEAEMMLQQGMRLVEATNRSGATATGHIIAARIAWARGAREEALEQIDLVSRHVPALGEGRLVPVQALEHKVNMLLQQGHLQEAQDCVLNCPVTEPKMSVFELEAWQRTQARMAIASGNVDEALRILERQREAIQIQGRAYSEVINLILQVRAHHANNAVQKALQVLEEALLLAEGAGCIRVFAEDGPVIPLLLSEYLSQAYQTSHVSQEYLYNLMIVLGPLAIPGAWQGQVVEKRERVQQMIEALSERELEVLQLLATGITNHEIARQLFVSVSTIKTHINNIYTKLGVHTRLQAVKKAREQGILYDTATLQEQTLHPDTEPMPRINLSSIKPLNSSEQ